MSGSITALPPPGYGVLGQVITASTNVHRNLDTLTGQASSGLIADTYAGLGNGATVSLKLSPQIAALQSWQNNINAANTRMQVTQTSMGQLESIASNFNAQLMNLNGLNASDVDNIAADARDALSQVTNLLDTQEGGIYVFGGQDSANPPVPNPNGILTSGFYTGIATEVGNLATTNSAAVTAANTLQIAASTAPGVSPFYADTSQSAASLQAPLVQVGDGIMQPIGLFASANAAVSSVMVSPTTGTQISTGSYMRDLMRSLATIGSLTGAQSDDPNFAGLVQDTRECLTGAITAMNGDIGVLGDTQASLTTTQTNLGDTATALTAQVSDAQDADMAATLSNLAQVQTQLQASYQLIAGMSSLSLAKFLPAA